MADGNIKAAAELVYKSPGAVSNTWELQGNEHFKQLQQQLSSALKQGIKRLHSKIDSLQRQMGSTQESQDVQKHADLLTANIYR